MPTRSSDDSVNGVDAASPIELADPVDVVRSFVRSAAPSSPGSRSRHADLGGRQHVVGEPGVRPTAQRRSLHHQQRGATRFIARGGDQAIEHVAQRAALSSARTAPSSRSDPARLAWRSRTSHSARASSTAASADRRWRAFATTRRNERRRGVLRFAARSRRPLAIVCRRGAEVATSEASSRSSVART